VGIVMSPREVAQCLGVWKVGWRGERECVVAVSWAVAGSCMEGEGDVEAWVRVV
jgi:hypothetical protein